MATEQISRAEAVTMVLDGLQVLILSHAAKVAAEEESPSPDADRADGIIADGRKAVTAYRQMRAEFEQVATGMLDQPRAWVVEVLVGNEDQARGCVEQIAEHTPLGMVRTRGLF